MKIRASSVVAAILAATCALASAAPPLAGVWNIAAKGQAGSSGELLFRVSPASGEDPVDITVPVQMGAKEDTVARNIHHAMDSQLRSDRFKVQLGEGGNVMVSDPRGRPAFAVELVNATVRNLRVAVQSVTPSASPTVPAQSAPAEPLDTRPRRPNNNAPGNAVPPAGDVNPPGPGITPPDNSIPVPSPAPAPSPSMPVPSPPAAPSPSMPVPNPSTPAPNPPTPAPGGTPPAPAPATPPAPANGAPAAAPPPASAPGGVS